MYQSIYRYAKKNGLAPAKNKNEKLVSARILLEEDGTYKRVEAYDKGTRTKELCPHIGTLYAQPKYANIICEKMGSILYGAGQPDEEIGSVKYRNGNAAWKAIMSEGAENDGVLSTIYTFIKMLDEDEEKRQEIYEELRGAGIKPDEFVSFRIGMSDAEKTKSWEPWFNGWVERHSKSEDADGGLAVSCITGEAVRPIRNAPFEMISTSQTGTGAYLASYGKDSPALNSYGINDNSGTPMSREEAEVIRAGMEYLLKSKSNHDDAFNVIYWYEGKAADILGPRLRKTETGSEKKGNSGKKKAPARIVRDREKEYTDALRRFMEDSREAVSKNHDSVFRIMNFQIPDKGRIYVSGEEETTYGELYNSISLWLSDSEVERAIWNKDNDKNVYVYGGSYMFPAGNLYRILFTLLNNRNAKNAFEQVKKEYGSDRYGLLKAMVFGTQIPKDIFYRAVNEATRQILSNGKVSFVAIQVIKTYLTRMERAMKGTENQAACLEKIGRARNFGRFFAVVEEMQYVSSNRRTLAERYYKGAKNGPMSTGNSLADLAVHYETKMRNCGKAKISEKLKSDKNEALIAAGSLPVRYSLEEKGAFDLGYAEQSQRYLIERQERIRAAKENGTAAGNDQPGADGKNNADAADAGTEANN